MEEFGRTVFITLFFSSLLFGFIGNLIDRNKGFWWGLLLGPLGLIIAAILKSRKNTDNHIIHIASPPHKYMNNDYNQNFTNREISNNKFDIKKWEVLKEVDPEISAAIDKVTSIDVSLENELAEKYLILGQKDYLHQIVDAIMKAHELKTAEGKSLDVLDYESYIGKEKFDARYGLKVLDVQVYNGSWKYWQGGVIVKFADGKTLLEKKGASRFFAKDDNSWN